MQTFSETMRPQLQATPLMPLKKVTHYAQYYAHNYFNYATVQLQIILFLMSTVVYIVHFIITAAPIVLFVIVHVLEHRDASM